MFKCDVSDETDTSETSKNLVNLLINPLYTYELFHLDSMSLGWFIVHIKGSHVGISNQSPKIVYCKFINSCEGFMKIKLTIWRDHCHLLIYVNHALVANCNVAYMCFNAIWKNKILAKICEFTVYPSKQCRP